MSACEYHNKIILQIYQHMILHFYLEGTNTCELKHRYNYL